MYFSKNIPGVNLVVMNYKIRHNKNQPATRPARYSLRGQSAFSVIICGGKTRSGHARLRARVEMEEGSFSV